MKKFIFGLFFCLFLFSFKTLSFADVIGARALHDSTNGRWVSLAMSSTTSTYTSSAIKLDRGDGFTSLLVLTSAGSLAITYEVSIDGTNFYTPKDVDGNALNVIASAMTANTWVEFDPTITLYIRFKFVVTVADSTVSAYLIYNE